MTEPRTARQQSASPGGQVAVGWRWQRATAVLTTVARELGRNRWPSVLTVLALATALALPMGGWVALSNLERVLPDPGEVARVSVLLAPGTSDAALIELADKLKLLAPVAEVVIFDSAALLDEYLDSLAVAASARDLAMVAELPALLELQLAGDPVAALSSLGPVLEAIPSVEEVIADWSWLQHLQDLREVLLRALLLLTLLMSASALFVVSNTLRMLVSAKSENIIVERLCGAGDGYISTPFVVSGMLFGIVGSLLAAACVSLAWRSLSVPLGRILARTNESVALSGPDHGQVLAVVAAAAAGGALVAWLTVKRHLRDEGF